MPQVDNFIQRTLESIKAGDINWKDMSYTRTIIMKIKINYFAQVCEELLCHKSAVIVEATAPIEPNERPKAVTNFVYFGNRFKIVKAMSSLSS